MESEFNLVRDLSRPGRRLLALAVFLIFSAMGPIQTLMITVPGRATWTRFVLLTLAAGLLAACILAFMFRPGRRVLASVFLVTGLLTQVSCFFSLYFPVDKLHWLLVGRIDMLARERLPAMAETTERALMLRRTLMGSIGIALLAGGYVLFIQVIRREGKRRVRLETELAIARDIQQSLLPASTFRTDWCTIAGRMLPAAEVGGDFFDVVLLSEHQVAVVVADVSGHGVGAGILAAMVKGALHADMEPETSPLVLVKDLNETVRRLTDKQTFVTLACLSLDARSGALRVATAGHPPVLHWCAETGSMETLRASSLPLGVSADGRFAELESTFARGDRLLLYTDGILEAMDASHGVFGRERLESLLGQSAAIGADALCDRVLEALSRFRGQEPLADDATVVAITL